MRYINFAANINISYTTKNQQWGSTDWQLIYNMNLEQLYNSHLNYQTAETFMLSRTLDFQAGYMKAAELSLERLRQTSDVSL